MNTPWIELKEYQDFEGPSAPGFRDHVWQALFACQVGVLPHKDWVKFKWGFNASALFDETLERQRLFLESQYRIRNETGFEEPDHRTLAFRLISRPGEDLLVAIVGKIHARTEAEVTDKALGFIQELGSTFPYDYRLIAALSRNEFVRFSGDDILETTGGESSLAQIKRAEFPIYPNRYAPTMQGLWQSAPRAHEQVWRALGGSTSPLLLSISLRSTVLHEKEREQVLRSGEEISNIIENESVNEQTLTSLKKWSRSYIERRMNPWARFFYLQIHFAGTGKIHDSFFRVAGSTLTLSKEGHSLPSYQVIFPRSGEEMSWRSKLKNLDLTMSGTFIPAPRLSEMADLEEVFAAMRLPYSPPEDGFPNLSFASTEATQEQHGI